MQLYCWIIFQVLGFLPFYTVGNNRVTSTSSQTSFLFPRIYRIFFQQCLTEGWQQLVKRLSSLKLRSLCIFASSFTLTAFLLGTANKVVCGKHTLCDCDFAHVMDRCWNVRCEMGLSWGFLFVCFWSLGSTAHSASFGKPESKELIPGLTPPPSSVTSHPGTCYCAPWEVALRSTWQPS